MTETSSRIFILENPPAILVSRDITLAPAGATSSVAVPTKLARDGAVPASDVPAALLQSLPGQDPKMASLVKVLLSLTAKATAAVPVLPTAIHVGVFIWEGVESYQSLDTNHFHVDRKTFLDLTQLLLSFLSIAAKADPSLKHFVKSVTEPAALILTTGEKVYTIATKPTEPQPLGNVAFYMDWDEQLSKLIHQNRT